MNTAKPHATVIVPLFNLRSTIEPTLASLAAQSLDASAYEIVFVDDGSSDGTPDVVEKWTAGRNARLIRNPRNLGRSRTRNRGVAAARGEILHFVDGDVIASPRLLEAVLERFRGGDVEVVSGRRRCLDLRSSPAGASGSFESARRASFAGQLASPMHDRLEQDLELVCARHPRSRTRALAFITSNVAVTAEALRRVGGFDPFLPRCEDTDLGLRLVDDEARFAYLADAEIVHLFERMDPRAPPLDESLQALFGRHPRLVVLAWFLFSTRFGQNEDRRLDSLVEIARAEEEGTLEGLDLEKICLETAPFRLPASTSATDRGVVALLAEDSGTPAGEVRRWLAGAVREGLLSRRRKTSVHHDVAVARAWLSERTPFRQECYRRSYFRDHLTPRQRGAAGAPPTVLQWNGHYEITARRDGLPLAGDGATLSFPLPGDVPPFQEKVRLDGFDPPCAGDFQRDGMILGLPIERAYRGRDLRVAVSFSCVVREAAGATPRELGERAGDVQRWAIPSRSGRHRVRLQAALADIFSGTLPRTSVERARHIYDWMLRELRFRALPFAEDSALVTGLGHCISLTWLFVSLCRLVGVPARERYGAPLARHEGEAGASTVQHFSPFAHSWAEFFAVERGLWLPVELLALSHDERTASERTFPDRDLRAQFVADGERYARYYFGQVDPLRIYTSAPAGRVPALVHGTGERSRDARRPRPSLRHALRVTAARVEQEWA